MLKLNNICKTFNLGDINEESIFHGVSLEVKDDDFICIVGSNGAGKSTLLNIVSGKLGIDRGSIILNGEDITDQVESQRCKKFLGFFRILH